MNIETLSAQFERQKLDVYNIHGERWLMANQIGLSLELAFPNRAIAKIHNRNIDEFGPDDTMLVDLPDAMGRMQPTRVFSQKGAIKIAMFARSDKAAAFRDWAAQVLTAPAATPEPQLTPAAIKELRGFWLKHPQNRKFLKYAAMPLTNAEIATLCGWKTASTVSVKRRAAEALGLLEPPANLAQLQARAAQNQFSNPAAAQIGGAA